MSYLLVSDFISSGKTALDNKNYWSALAIALMLPSICSRIEYENNEQYFSMRPNGAKKWHDKKAYTDWCKTYFDKPNMLQEMLEDDIPDTLYNLRCDIVHAGVANINCGGKPIYFSIGESVPGYVKFDDKKIINIETFCNSVFDIVSMWILKFGANSHRKTYVFNMNERDDKLLYSTLCDEARTKKLRKDFDDFVNNANLS